jgi:hypothetical protein
VIPIQVPAKQLEWPMLVTIASRTYHWQGTAKQING